MLDHLPLNLVTMKEDNILLADSIILMANNVNVILMAGLTVLDHLQGHVTMKEHDILLADLIILVGCSVNAIVMAELTVLVHLQLDLATMKEGNILLEGLTTSTVNNVNVIMMEG